VLEVLAVAIKQEKEIKNLNQKERSTIISIYRWHNLKQKILKTNQKRKLLYQINKFGKSCRV
jgi:hypothetical protein